MRPIIVYELRDVSTRIRALEIVLHNLGEEVNAIMLELSRELPSSLLPSPRVTVEPAQWSRERDHTGEA